jgi:hypothetical protein
MSMATPPSGTHPAGPPAPPLGTTGTGPAGAYTSNAASVGDLLGNVTRDLSTLMRQELALAQAELKQEATKTGKAAGAFGGAGFAAWFLVLFLSLALWAGLSNLMHPAWAALIVAAIWAVIAAILYTTGRAKFREVHPKPERTVDTLGQVPDALKGNRGGTP